MPELIKDDSSYTLSAQVNYWLSYILDIPTELQTERRLDDVVEVQYKSDGLGNISPFQLGAGVSYLTKMLIMCLRAKKNDVILIENPEIHLHPASQAKVGEFLAFIVLADEPTGNLDSKTSADVLGLLQRTTREFNQTLVMITHNNEIAQLADRIVRIEDGRIKA